MEKRFSTLILSTSPSSQMIGLQPFLIFSKIAEISMSKGVNDTGEKYRNLRVSKEHFRGSD